MVEVTIDSIRVSLMSQHRVVILKDIDSERYLPIWIGPCEADAITVELQEVEVARPLTRDILTNVIQERGADVSHILVRDLRDDVFYAFIVLDQNGTRLEVDTRPSDALAIAVRVSVPIFVEDDVMDQAGIVPEPEMEAEDSDVDDERLSAFADFVDTLDLEDLDDEEE